VPRPAIIAIIAIRKPPRPPSGIEYSAASGLIDRRWTPTPQEAIGSPKGRSIPINDEMRLEDINQVFSDMRALKLDDRMILISF
jgi:hypothetical protein